MGLIVFLVFTVMFVDGLLFKYEIDDESEGKKND